MPQQKNDIYLEYTNYLDTRPLLHYADTALLFQTHVGLKCLLKKCLIVIKMKVSSLIRAQTFNSFEDIRRTCLNM